MTGNDTPMRGMIDSLGVVSCGCEGGAPAIESAGFARSLGTVVRAEKYSTRSPARSGGDGADGGTEIGALVITGGEGDELGGGTVIAAVVVTGGGGDESGGGAEIAAVVVTSGRFWSRSWFSGIALENACS